jgi:hypothetical protein
MLQLFGGTAADGSPICAMDSGQNRGMKRQVIHALRHHAGFGKPRTKSLSK